ncbi:MAG: DUF4058 family protein [Planctomycetes bacterium]|nr:DUF4058 family protein [Planctomycetota bacterium]
MPIRDHHRPPIQFDLPWPSLHSGWISTITERLNELLPPKYLALDSLRLSGGLEIDISAVGSSEAEDHVGTNGSDGCGVALATASAVYSPPAAVGTASFEIPELAEIKVYTDRGPRRLVGAIELISPGNKDRPESRTAFVGKCLDYLGAGASVVIVDVVTDRHANLHNELIEAIGAPSDLELPEASYLYAAAYRPVVRTKRTEIDVWTTAFSVGDALPTMPLRLIADLFVPVELEATYTEACRRRRLV